MPKFRVCITEYWENIVEVDAPTAEDAVTYAESGFEQTEGCDYSLIEFFCTERQVTDINREGH